MTYVEIIETVDRRMPNDYTSDEKHSWLYQLDEQIWAEIYMTHELPDGQTAPTSGGDVLLPDQFAEEVYVAYLQACIAWHNEEDARYDRYITRFNDAYLRFCRWYNERHRPIPHGEYWGF